MAFSGRTATGLVVMAVLGSALAACGESAPTLGAEDVDPDVVGGAVVGDRRQQLDRELCLARPLGDTLAPIGVDLAREVDVPGAVAAAVPAG